MHGIMFRQQNDNVPPTSSRWLVRVRSLHVCREFVGKCSKKLRVFATNVPPLFPLPTAPA